MEGGVEAGDGRQPGPQRVQCSHRRDGRWIVQRSEIRQPLEAVLDRGVDDRRPGELGAAVDDPVAGRVDLGDLLQHRLELPAQLGLVPGCATLARADDPVVRIEHPQLQARGAGIDGEDAARRERHRQAAAQVQSRTSGMSSRCSRT